MKNYVKRELWILKRHFVSSMDAIVFEKGTFGQFAKKWRRGSLPIKFV